MATHLENEAALLAQARLGDGEAFGTLANQYHRHIYRHALKITGNREDAEDVTQDALFKAYCGLGQFRAKSRFYTWLVRITINQALMKLRKQRSKRETLWEDIGIASAGQTLRPLEPKDFQPSPEARCAEIEMRTILSRAVGALHPRLATVFTLMHVEDFSVRETAKMLGLSVPAVKSRSMRARLKLRQQFTQRTIAGLSGESRRYRTVCRPS